MPSVRDNNHSSNREQGLRRDDGVPSFIFVIRYHDEVSMDSDPRHDYHEAFRGRDSMSRDRHRYDYQGYSCGNRADSSYSCHDRRGNEYDYYSDRRFRDGRSGRYAVEDHRYNNSRRDERHRNDYYYRGNDYDRSEGRRESHSNRSGSTWYNNARSYSRSLSDRQDHGSQQSSRSQKRNRY